MLQDVPPFVTVPGYPAKPRGINNEGLRRRGFPAEDILAVQARLQDALPRGAPLDDARAALAGRRASSPALAPLVEFLAEPGRGIVR